MFYIFVAEINHKFNQMRNKLLFVCIAVCAVFTLVTCKKGDPNTGVKVESVTFKKASYEITEDEGINLKKELLITPTGLIDTCKTLKWNVSDDDIAQMDGSYLVAKRSGEVKVTVTVQGSKTATCNVVITEIPVESLTLKDMNIALFETTKIDAKTEPEGISLRRFEWINDNPSVAKIDVDGNVTGLSEGTAHITATYGTDISETCTVTVKKIAVTSITLSQTSIRQTEPGGEVQLIATVKPDNATYPDVTWTSNNESVASVSDNGLVTIKAMGTATIFAKADGKSASCSVDISPIRVTSIKLNKYGHNFSYNQQTFQIQYTLEPADATDYKIEFSTSNNSVAIVSSNGLVTCQNVGYALITCKDAVTGNKSVLAVTRPEIGTVTDCQGNKYKTVKIKDTWWMAENLKCTQYDTESPKSSVILTQSSTPENFGPYYQKPDFKEAVNLVSGQSDRAGLLYSWAAAVGLDNGKYDGSYTAGQGICPNGWKMPSKKDAEELYYHIFYELNMTHDRRNTASTAGWNNEKNNGYNLYGFDAIPTGWYNNYYTDFPSGAINAGSESVMWLGTKDGDANKYSDCMLGNEPSRSTLINSIGLSVRCIKK